jgi:hypothetical protein
MTFFSQSSFVYRVKIYWTELYLISPYELKFFITESTKYTNFSRCFSEIIGYSEVKLNPSKRAVDKAQVCSILKAVTVKNLTVSTREWLSPCSCWDLWIFLNLHDNLHSYAHCNCRTARFLNFSHYLVLRGPIREYSSFCRTQLCTSAFIPLRTRTGPTAEVCFLF